MPALPVVPATKVEIIGNMEGAGFANIFHFGAVSGYVAPTAAQLLTFLNAFEGVYKTDILPHLSVGITVTSAKATDLSSPSGAVAEAGYADAGGVGTGALAVSTAIVLSWAIPSRYRGGHPRTYLPGIPVGVTTNYRQLTAAAQTAFQTAGQAFLTGVNALTLGTSAGTLTCVHYRKDKVPLLVPVQEAISACTVHSRLDSQRRRLGKETT